MRQFIEVAIYMIEIVIPNCDTHIVQYLKNKGNQAIKFGQLIEAFSLKNSMQNAMENLFPDSF